MKALLLFASLASVIFASAQTQVRIDNSSPDYIEVRLLNHREQAPVQLAPNTAVTIMLTHHLDRNELIQVYWGITKARLDSHKIYRSLPYEVFNNENGNDWVITLRRDPPNRKWTVDITMIVHPVATRARRWRRWYCSWFQRHWDKIPLPNDYLKREFGKGVGQLIDHAQDKIGRI